MIHNTDELYLIIVVHNVFSRPAICYILDDLVRLINEKRLLVQVKEDIKVKWKIGDSKAS
jgi:hypothetical protein